MSKKKWTIDDIPDLSGKVAIVTGGNVGLGYESVKALAQKGAEVILAGRSPEKCESALQEIKEKAQEESGGLKGKIEFLEIDLASFDSIENFARNFHKKYKRLDILLNNAALMAPPYFKTIDGLESQMGTNHFGHFKLTGLLIDLLKKSPGSRVVTISSGAHRSGKIDFDNLLYEDGKGYKPMQAYARSKLSNLLFTHELQRKFEAQKIDSIAAGAHPGAAITALTRYTPVIKALLPIVAQSAAQGALPQLRAAAGVDICGGDYFGPHRMATGHPVKVKPSRLSRNEEVAARLWEISEKITGTKFLS